MPHVQSSRIDLKLKASVSLHHILSLNRETVEMERRRRSRKILQTTKRNARIITLAAICSACNRRQGVDLKLKLIENSVRIPKRECRQQTQSDQELHLYTFTSCASTPSPLPLSPLLLSLPFGF